MDKELKIKLLCFWIPIKFWRHRLKRYLYNREVFSECWGYKTTETKVKRDDLLANCESIETLFLGSSHVAYGVQPRYFSTASYNLGSNSQDLCSSYQLYSLLQPKLPRLKSIILGYSVFSPGFDLQQTSLRRIADILAYHYEGFQSDGHSTPDETKMIIRLSKHARVRHNEMGYLYPPQLPIDAETVEQRVETHMRENLRGTGQNSYIEKFVEGTRLNGHSFSIVLFPARQAYKALLPAKDILFADMLRLAKQGRVRVVDFYDDSDFNDSDFHDFDHLNETGARKLTEKLKWVLG